ncbi:MAG: alpha/beta hydrolase [Chloroflexota bacterium]
MPSTTRSVPVSGGRLHAVEDGEGPPIVLVHAGIADHRSWDGLVPFLVDAGHRAIRYDTRGWGRSATDDVEYSNRADLRAILDDFGIGRAALVGNSRGAMICLDTIIETPGRAVAFAWVGGAIGGFEIEPSPAELRLFERMEAAEEAYDGEAVAAIDVALWVDGPGQPPTRVPAWIRDLVHEMDRPLYDRDRVMGTSLALEPPANERLREVRLPVLAVVGALDTSVTVAASQRLQAGVAGVRRVVLPDVAHMVGMEAPDRLAGLILDLIRPLGTWG